MLPFPKLKLRPWHVRSRAFIPVLFLLLIPAIITLNFDIILAICPSRHPEALEVIPRELSCRLNTSTVSLAPPPHNKPLSLRRYIRWHRKARACLFDDSCHSMPLILIWRFMPEVGDHNHDGSIGDRFRGINIALIWAILSERIFFIDMPAGRNNLFPLESALLPVSLDWRLPSDFVDPPDILLLNWLIPVNRELLPLPHKMFNFYEDDFSSAVQQYPVIATGITWNPSLLFYLLIENKYAAAAVPDMHPSMIEHNSLLRVIAKALFRPGEAVSNLAREVIFSDGKPYMSVHARTGEDVGEGWHSRFAHVANASWEVATGLLDCAQAEDTLGTGRVFLASDSVTVKKAFASVAEQRGVEVAMVQESAVHVSEASAEMKERLRASEQCEGFLNVFVDLILLAGGESIIMTTSGFSRLAFLWGNATHLRDEYGVNGSQCV